MPIQLSGSLVITGSITTTGGITISGSILSASYSDTASFSNNFRVLGNLTASTALVTGTLTAQTLVVQTVTSSIVYSSGSNIFGSVTSNLQTFTGSVNITGSLSVIGSATFSSTLTTGDMITNNTGGIRTLSSLGYALRNDANNANLGALTRRSYWAGNASLDTQLYAETGYGIFINVNGSQSAGLNISSSGNVGIGVTNPTGSLTIKAEVTNTPTIAFQNSLGGPNSAISNYASAVQTFTVIGTNVYVNSAAGLARFNTNYEGSGITFDEGIIRFSTGTTSITPTTRMNIASNGKISINAPTLADAFNVQGANNYWTSIFTSGTTTSQAYGVYIKAGTNASDVSFLIQNTSGTDILRILGTGTTTFSGSVTASGVTATEIYANSSINMLNGYVRLRNAANTATYGLLIQKAIWIGSGTDYSPAIAAETGYGIYTYTNGATSPSGPYVSPGGTTWTNGSSDSRKKKNFETTQGLTEVLQIEPIKYHFNEDDDNSKKRLGFKAQNILPLIPEMVLEKDEFAEDGSPYLTITPDYILPVLVKAIQELSAKVTALEKK